MALKVGEGLTAGSSRLMITIKASVETQWCTLQTDVTSANGGGGEASFALPEFKSKMAKLLLLHLPPKCTVWQDLPVSRCVQFKNPFYALLRGLCWVLRMAEVLDVREISNCTSPKLDLGLKMPQPLSPPSIFTLSGPSILLRRGHGFSLP